jgi:endonuclease G
MPDLKKIAFDKNTLLACTGFSESFVKGAELKLSRILGSSYESLLPNVEGDKKGKLKYTNLTVLYNAKRRVPFVAAYNIDGARKASGIKRANNFQADPRIDKKIQLSKEAFYDLITDRTEFEIGHMAANNEMAWGTNAQLQSYQTFHFPNSVPQAERLNTGIWKSLESYIIDESATITGKKLISVFTGPIIRSDDPPYIKDKTFKVPLLFYKVIVFPSAQGVFSTAFIISHEAKLRKDKLLVLPPGLAETVPETFQDFKFKKVFQVNIGVLEDLSGLNFSWTGVKKIKVPAQANQIKAIRKIEDSDDAAAHNLTLRTGGIPTTAIVTESLTSSEVASKKFKLNIILPT